MPLIAQFASVWLISVLLLLAQPQNQSDQPDVRLTSDLVLLNLTVTGPDRRYVRGLRADDFIVLEDGVAQQITTFSSQETPLAAAILLDVSGSMQQMVRIARGAARNFASKLRADDVFALYVFADQATQLQDFGSSPELDERIWSLQAEGYTALYDCIYLAAKDLSQRPERRRAILLLSDGADTKSSHTLDTCLRMASDAAVTIYAVNLTPPAHARRADSIAAAGVLQTLAEKTGGRYIDDPGGMRMYQAFEEILDELSHQYTLGYSPTPEKRDGKWHKIEVKATKPNISIRTRQGYLAPKRN
ncbi:MAG: VWA domain-containing protein [Acidobacteriota bacterium]|nr:VWA domain-containing protein [Blastocatellia bacterium]MDW8241208.1 VWA domain-containing protein [Acidobacteriota bacterium]